MTGTCQDVQRFLWTHPARPLQEERPAFVQPHIETCTDCMLEARRADLLASSLARLRPQLAQVPASLEASLIARAAHRPAAWERAWELALHPGVRRGAAVAAALGAATTAAAYGVIRARRMMRPDLAT